MEGGDTVCGSRIVVVDTVVMISGLVGGLLVLSMHSDRPHFLPSSPLLHRHDMICVIKERTTCL